MKEIVQTGECLGYEKLVASLLFVVSATLAFGENLYRTQINDGEWQYWETIADEKPRYRGAVKDEKLVWTPRQSGLMLILR